ncbi:MAG: metal ABC transporter ATP-binding protein [Dehalococcoidia bacterium]
MPEPSPTPSADQFAATGASGPLVLDRVQVGYDSTFVLSGMTIEAGPGDIVGVIGPNGSGKSTLLKAVARVLPLRAGRITLAGRGIEEYAGRIAFVPQREDVNWDFPATALDVAMMGRYRNMGWLRWPSHRDRQRAEAALERLGLGGMGRRHISQFSGGQQQRIFLARALVQDPLVVLLDEPFTGIDAANRAVFHEAIAGFARAGIIVLMATHDLDEMAMTCSHVCCVNERLVAFGRTEDVYTPEVLKETFAGQLAVFT